MSLFQRDLQWFHSLMVSWERRAPIRGRPGTQTAGAQGRQRNFYFRFSSNLFPAISWCFKVRNDTVVLSELKVDIFLALIGGWNLIWTNLTVKQST